MVDRIIGFSLGSLAMERHNDIGIRARQRGETLPPFQMIWYRRKDGQIRKTECSANEENRGRLILTVVI